MINLLIAIILISIVIYAIYINKKSIYLLMMVNLIISITILFMGINASDGMIMLILLPSILTLIPVQLIIAILYFFMKQKFLSLLLITTGLLNIYLIITGISSLPSGYGGSF